MHLFFRTAHLCDYELRKSFPYLSEARSEDIWRVGMSLEFSGFLVLPWLEAFQHHPLVAFPSFRVWRIWRKSGCGSKLGDPGAHPASAFKIDQTVGSYDILWRRYDEPRFPPLFEKALDQALLRQKPCSGPRRYSRRRGPRLTRQGLDLQRVKWLMLLLGLLGFTTLHLQKRLKPNCKQWQRNRQFWKTISFDCYWSFGNVCQKTPDRTLWVGVVG